MSETFKWLNQIWLPVWLILKQNFKPATGGAVTLTCLRVAKSAYPTSRRRTRGQAAWLNREKPTIVIYTEKKAFKKDIGSLPNPWDGWRPTLGRQPAENNDSNHATGWLVLEEATAVSACTASRAHLEDSMRCSSFLPRRSG